MIPIIGVMIGSYIIIRMLSFITREGPVQDVTFVKVLCALNIVFTLFLMGGLVLSSSTSSLK